MILEGDYLSVYEKRGRLLMKVNRTENRLYKVNLEDSNSMCLLSKTEENTWLWHARLGHVNFQVLELLSKKGLEHEIPNLIQPSKKCEGFLMTKQTRSPFPSHTNLKQRSHLN